MTATAEPPSAAKLTTTIPGAARDEAAIRQLIADFIRALCAKDLDRMMMPYAPGIVLFDAIPPFKTSGVNSLRTVWEGCLPCFPDAFGVEMRDLQIIVGGGDVALAHWFMRFTGMDPDHGAMKTWLRATGGYRRNENRWEIVHEHVSVPFDPITSKAAFSLHP